jgi:hypothetical protein
VVGGPRAFAFAGKADILSGGSWQMPAGGQAVGLGQAACSDTDFGLIRVGRTNQVRRVESPPKQGRQRRTPT